MPVKVEGVTVRGYKAEQFADAFHRVLGVTSVTGVTSRMAPQAAGNASNASNASPTSGRIPLSGDPDFADWIDQKLQDGHLTEAEWLERRKLHALVVRP
jgi:hypothetical protein